MNVPLTVVTLAGSVALLLWGVRMVQTGVQRAFGAKLRSTLGQALENRFKVFLAGAGVTAILHSSNLTGLMITRFAAGGHVERLRSRRIDTAETSALRLDALRDLKDVNAHLVAGAMYPVLESKGELLAGRLRRET